MYWKVLTYLIALLLPVVAFAQPQDRQIALARPYYHYYYNDYAPYNGGNGSNYSYPYSYYNKNYNGYANPDNNYYYPNNGYYLQFRIR